MIQAIILLLRILLFSFGSASAVAEAPAPAVAVQIEGVLAPISNAQLIDAIIATAPVVADAGQGELSIEPAAASLSDDWMEDNEAGVAYALTGTLSLGLDYEHEGIEDLTADLIEMGTAGVDYTSHKVLVRANVAFDFIP